MESGGNGYLFSGDKKKRYYDFTLLFMVIALMLVVQMLMRNKQNHAMA